MLDKTKKVYTDGKKSLESILREKAFSEVKKDLEEKNIDIDDVSDEGIEALVAAKTQDISFSVINIFNVATNPFEKKENLEKNYSKKDRILAKEKLSTRSDLIMKKYMKD